jgi:hypothetical protein
MRKNMDWAPGSGARILAVERDGDHWVISAVGRKEAPVPDAARRRHVGTADISDAFQTYRRKAPP